MSALVVHPEHIHVLIWAALRPIAGSYQDLTWYYGNPTHLGRLALDNRNEIGHMLLAANTASVNHTYSHHAAEAEYTYQQPLHTEWSPGEILQAIHAYEHQTDFLTAPGGTDR